MPRLTSVDDNEIFYRDLGEGRPVLLVHGWGASHEFFDPQITALCDDYRVVPVDLRGHGKSDKPASGYTYDDHCRDLQAVVDQLGLSDVTLLGWSMGGGVAFNFAGKWGDSLSQLVLVGPAAPKYLAGDGWEYGMSYEEAAPLREQERTDTPAFRQWVYEQATHVDVGEETRRWFWECSMQTPTWSGLKSWDALVSEDMRDLVPEITVPTLILQGEEDALVPGEAVEYLGDELDSVEVTFYEECGHTPHWEVRETFNQDLTEFLAGA